MKTILITIVLLATIGIIIFSYAVEAVNVDFDSKGNIVEKDPLFRIDLNNLGGGTGNPSSSGQIGP